MTSLTTKRRLAYEHSRTPLPNINLDASAINLNTDELESKLDTLNVNTIANEFTLSYASTIAAAAIDLSSSIDFGTSLNRHHVQIVATTTNTNTDCILQVSSDNVTYFDLAQFSIPTIGTKISGIGDVNFRYLRVATTNSHSSSIDLNLLIVAKNIK